MANPDSSAQPIKIHHDSPQFRPATIGLLLISAAMFSSLYCTQGILPQISEGLHISADKSQLTVLVSTGCLAVGMFPMSLISERYGRRNIMLVSVILAAVVGLFIPFCFTFSQLLILKGAQGLFLAGVSSIVIAYVGEEFESTSITRAMGMYVAGSALGGLLGRMFPLWIADATHSWQWGMGGATLLTVSFTAVFVKTLPPSYFFTPTPHSFGQSAKLFLTHLTNPALLSIYAIVFCAMGAYVSLYNGLPFHMESPPINLSPSLYSTFFLVSLVGTLAARQTGKFSAKFGVKRSLLLSIIVLSIGLVPLYFDHIWTAVIGSLLVTAGGFSAHTCLTGLVAIIAKEGRAQAAALYMACFYGGSAIAGYLGSQIFVDEHWMGLMLYMAALVLVGFFISALIRLPKDHHS